MAIASLHDSSVRIHSDVRATRIGEREVFVKDHRPGGWLHTAELAREFARCEAEMVQSLAARPTSDQRLGKVQLVSADLEAARVITQRVQGELVERRIIAARSTAARRDVLRALCLAGRWLRDFQSIPHDVTTPPDDPASPADLVMYCDLRLATLQSLGYRAVTDRLREQVTSRVGDWLAATPDAHLEKVWCHGDYGPFNLLWDGHRLTPIDFATCRFDYPLVDLTYLIHRIVMLRWQFPWRQWPIESYRAACLQGYGLAEVELPPLYRALMVRHMLCRLQSLVRQPPLHTRQRLHNIWVRSRVRLGLEAMVGL